jgi:hypothetical protein
MSPKCARATFTVGLAALLVTELPTSAWSAHGTLDPAFGGDGTVVNDVGERGASPPRSSSADGKIVAGGTLNASNGHTLFVLVRFLANGTPTRHSARPSAAASASAGRRTRP